MEVLAVHFVYFIPVLHVIIIIQIRDDHSQNHAIVIMCSQRNNINLAATSTQLAMFLCCNYCSVLTENNDTYTQSTIIVLRFGIIVQLWIHLLISSGCCWNLVNGTLIMLAQCELWMVFVWQTYIWNEYLQTLIILHGHLSQQHTVMKCFIQESSYTARWCKTSGSQCWTIWDYAINIIYNDNDNDNLYLT